MAPNLHRYTYPLQLIILMVYLTLYIDLGLENSLQNKILYQTKGFVNDYSENVDPTVLNEHATAAFRFFHSLIAGRLE